MNDQQSSQRPQENAPGAVDAEAFARSVAETSDAELAQGMNSELREQILDEIFRRMAEHVRPDQVGDTDAVIQWQIAGRPDGEADRYEIVLRDRACRVSEEPAQQPQVTLKIGAVEFLRLVTGGANGPNLFMEGKLKIDGDLMLATRLAGMFSIPRAAQ